MGSTGEVVAAQRQPLATDSDQDRQQQALNITLSPGAPVQPFAICIVYVLVFHQPVAANSTPTPDCLTPPKGASGWIMA